MREEGESGGRNEVTHQEWVVGRDTGISLHPICVKGEGVAHLRVSTSMWISVRPAVTSSYCVPSS